MTYGPPNQGGPVPGQPAQNPAVAAITAPAAKEGDKLFIAGIAIAVLGLLLVIFSCLNWLTISDDESDDSISISGLGSVSADFPDQDWPDDMKAEFEKQLEKETNAPGGWTLAFGILGILSAVPLLIRKFQGFGALGAAAFGFAATICAIVFTASTYSGVIDTDGVPGSDELASTGYGLWIVLFGSLGLLLAAAYAVALVVAPDKVGGSKK